MITKKYTNPDAEHHKERPQASGDTTVMVKTTANFYDLVTDVGVTQNFPSVSVSNREYEERENEKKRTIKYVRTPKYEEVPYPEVMEPNLVIEYYSR